MAQATQKYSRSLTGSIGAGMKSLVGGGGRRYYVLEHKVSSKYHEAGENQRIIVDQIELGRDPECQVRFDDEHFGIVSRRHAAIVKDGDNWKLIHLSQSNPTYLNGHPVTKEWYLQNGDEIQLATNGPKLGFIVPEGEKGLVKSIGLTARMSLFRQQALKPYKQAIIVLSCIFIIAGCACAYVINQQEHRIDVQDGTIADNTAQIENQNSIITAQSKRLSEQTEQLSELISANEELNSKLNNEINNNNNLRTQIDRLRDQMQRLPASSQNIPVPERISSLSKDVYWIKTDKVVAIINGEEKTIQDLGWIATGFLLNDGRFVTARHCVHGWRYPQGEPANIIRSAAISELEDNGVIIKAYMTAYSNDGTVLRFTSDQFTTDGGRTDIQDQLQWTDEEGQNHVIRFKRGNFDGTDYAWVAINKRGSLKANPTLSKNLQASEKVYVLGYPYGFGAGTDVSSQTDMEPSYSESSVARRGLTENGRIHLSNRNFEGGNSGGPVFVFKDNEFQVVAIVSHGMESIGFVTPISNIVR